MAAAVECAGAPVVHGRLSAGIGVGIGSGRRTVGNRQDLGVKGLGHAFRLRDRKGAGRVATGNRHETFCFAGRNSLHFIIDLIGDRVGARFQKPYEAQAGPDRVTEQIRIALNRVARHTGRGDGRGGGRANQRAHGDRAEIEIRIGRGAIGGYLRACRDGNRRNEKSYGVPAFTCVRHPTSGAAPGRIVTSCLQWSRLRYRLCR